MIVMGARGFNRDGTGGEIAIYWSELSRQPFLLLKPNRFSYWLWNTWNALQNRFRKNAP